MTPRWRLVLVLVALGIPGGRLLLGTGPEAAPPAAETVLQVMPVQPPGLPPQLLVLTARDPHSPQPRHSNLWRVDPTGAAPPVRLSPHSSYNFWAMCAGDVTGDGVEEIGLCTDSTTVLDDRYARRFFVYAWDEQGDLRPLWRGSRLSRPYHELTLADVTGDGRADLVSVETGLGGGRLLSAYRWNQFGFWGLGESEEYAELALHEAGPEGVRVLARTEPEADARDLLLVLREGRWTPAEPDPAPAGSLPQGRRARC